MINKSYHVIGLMSGTSLDGVDLAYCVFTYENNNWIYKILNTYTFPYNISWIQQLSNLLQVSGKELIETHHLYGNYLGQLVQAFMEEHHLQPDFIASHGHTVFHQPEQHISFQVGSGAYLAAAANKPVVCDFRTLDIAFGGQGAPLVPIGDKLLFNEYDFCLNLGGIANISFETDGKRIAFDICACNMLLNTLANELNLPYDQDGELAKTGQLNQELLNLLNQPDYFEAPYPKSIGKEWADQNSLAQLTKATCSVSDKLQTACRHIAFQISQSIKNIITKKPEAKILITGGGALNKYLVQLITEELGSEIKVVVPDDQLINFKEALIFAFLGVLRWEQQPNCLQSVTGARQDAVGGAIYYV